MDTRPKSDRGGWLVAPGRRTHGGAWALPVAIVTLLAVLWAGGRALGGDTAQVDMTGHWASPLEASGIDIVQTGASVSGSSHSGLHLEGAISGRRVDFTFWRGGTFKKADPEDRGTGVMVVAKNGQRAVVTWRNDKKKAPDEGRFVIVRVGPPDADGPKPALADDDGADPHPDASLSPEDKARLDDLYDQVLDSIDQIRHPELPDPNSTPAPTPRPVIRPPESSAAKEGIDATLPDPSWPPLWTPPPNTQEEWLTTLEEVLDKIEGDLGSLQTQILDALIEASAEQIEDGTSP